MRKSLNIKRALSFTLILLGICFLASAQVGEAVVAEELYVNGFGRKQQDLSKLPKMDRDIVIAQNILDELISGGSRIFGNSSKGMYIPGKGIIFSSSYNTRFGNVLFASNATIIEEESSDKDKSEVDYEEKNKEMVDDLNEKAKEFLLDYSSILSDLKPNEKVMLNVSYRLYKSVKKDRNRGAFSYTIGGQKSNRMVASIDYKDIQDYISGKTNRSTAESKINFTTTTEEEGELRDAKIMAGILDDLFQSTADGQLRASGRTSWTYFDGFGLMFDMKLAQRRSRSNSPFIVVDGEMTTYNYGQDAKEEEKDEEKVDMNEVIDNLISSATESLVSYGRTLRSVKDGEVVILNIDLGRVSRKQDMPGALRLQVAKSTINNYAQGKVSLEQVKNQIDITKLSGAINGNASEAVYIGGTSSFPSVGTSKAVSKSKK